MSTKKNEQTQQPSPADELLKKGTLTLNADSRASIYAQAEELLKALPLCTKWTRTFVEFDGQGTFSQTYYIFKND